jgi:hypothetical protein
VGELRELDHERGVIVVDAVLEDRGEVHEDLGAEQGRLEPRHLDPP